MLFLFLILPVLVGCRGSGNTTDGSSNAMPDPLPGNQSPTALITGFQQVKEADRVVLDGSVSIDLEQMRLKYQCSQIPGVPATLVNRDSSLLVFTAPDVTQTETLTFQHSITDS